MKEINRQGAKIIILLFFALGLLAGAKRPAVISVDAQITVKVKSGYHVQANPASEEYLIPTKLDVKSTADLQAGNPVYPKGQPFKLEGSDKPLATYVDSFVIKVPVKADAKAHPANETLQGVLRYQACDAHSCLFPDSIPVELPVTIK